MSECSVLVGASVAVCMISESGVRPRKVRNSQRESPHLRRLMKIVRYAAWTVGGVVALVLLCGGGLYAYTQSHINRKWEVAGHPLIIPTDSVSVERGRHLATTIGK